MKNVVLPLHCHYSQVHFNMMVVHMEYDLWNKLNIGQEFLKLFKNVPVA